MQKIGYDGYRFPPEIIQQAVWLYLRFTLSFRDAFAERRSRAAATRRQTRRRISHVFPMHLNQTERRGAAPVRLRGARAMRARASPIAFDNRKVGIRHLRELDRADSGAKTQEVTVSGAVFAWSPFGHPTEIAPTSAL
jgi:hypothetical protein